MISLLAVILQRYWSMTFCFCFHHDQFLPILLASLSCSLILKHSYVYNLASSSRYLPNSTTYQLSLCYFFSTWWSSNHFSCFSHLVIMFWYGLLSTCHYIVVLAHSYVWCAILLLFIWAHIVFPQLFFQKWTVYILFSLLIWMPMLCNYRLQWFWSVYHTFLFFSNIFGL